jgi:hypothetical protein
MISKLSAHLGPASIFSGISGPPSLVLHLDAGNTFSYIGTGSTWYDLTNLNNDIELSNTTFNSTYNQLSQFKGSFEFGGTNSGGALISGTAIPLMDSHYTIESWIQANSYDVIEDGGIIGWGGYSNNYEVNALRQSGGGFKNYWWGSDLQAIPGTTPSVDYWYHVASTYDGTNRTIYLNGESLGTDVPGVTHSVPYFNNLTVGVTNDPEFFNGRISTIKVWNKNLNSTQLLSAFNSDKSKYGYDFGSMTFDGTQSAYLISSSSDYAFGTNDFTVEAFFKSSDYSLSGGIVSLRDNSTYINGVGINLTHTATPSVTPLIEFSSGNNFLTYTASVDEWYHVAISRVGSTSSFFINGNLFNEVEDTLNYGNNDLVVGRYYTDIDGYYFNGIISNVRVLNGTGLYTGTFSPPSVQLSSTESNTEFLITSQEINPTADLTGLHSVTASNIGWTSSLPSIAPPYVTESLQFYVDAGVPSSYSGTGTTWYDISGNSRNLTMNSLSYNSNDGGYIIFDGAHIAESSAYTINFSNGFTVESVAKFSGSSYEGLFAFNGGGNFINVQAQGGTNIRWEIDSGSSFTTTNSLSSNTWYHVTCVYEGSSNGSSATARIYINGVENNTSSLYADRTGNSQNQTSSFVLGSWDGYLTGNIALSRMYNKVLDSTEVLQNFNYTKDRFGL